MRSSLAWCLEPQFCEREPKSPALLNGNSHDKGSYVRKTQVRENFERIRREAPLLREQGLNGRQIAFRLDVSRDSVYRALREMVKKWGIIPLTTALPKTKAQKKRARKKAKRV